MFALFTSYEIIIGMIFDFLQRYRGKTEKTVHLDFASTTPVRKEVLKAMLPYFRDVWANPSAIYQSGIRARNVIEDMRAKLAHVLHIRSYGVIFTSGGTESNNLAIIGLIEALHDTGRAYADMEIISTQIEHPSVLEVLKVLSKKGVNILFLNVNEEGLIDSRELTQSLSQKTVLITFAYANSEVGVVQEVKKITRVVRAWNEKHDMHVYVHLDASQAPLWLPCELDMLGVDLMTLDAGKCYGPKGVGVLAMRHGVSLNPILFGGGQERGLRSGTENTPLIIGCVMALMEAQRLWKSRSEAVASLRDFMIEEIRREIPGAIVNGSTEHRIANNVNISIPGIDTEFATVVLDTKGIAASTRSACGGEGHTGSSVVRTITKDEGRATSTLRFTLGEETTKDDILTATKALEEHILKMETFTKSLH